MVQILSGVETIKAALAGRSLARFGDGEFRLCLDGSAVSQVNNVDLTRELRAILKGPTKSLACIPRQGVGPKADRWVTYGPNSSYWTMLGQEVYGSAFISRPDSEPEINTPEYWADVRALWKNRDTILVKGTDGGSLDEKMLADARSLDVIYGQRRDAYGEINSIEEAIGQQPADRPIIMCLGACATALAERLARKGMWALDLGHIGKFMPKELRYP